MTRDRLGLIVYLAALLFLSMTQQMHWLLAGALVVLIAGGRQAPRLARRAILATVFFAGLVSATWAISAALQGEVPWAALARLNLRAFALTLLTFTAAANVDFEAALSFSPRLQTLFVLIRAQLLVYRRLLADFRLAARSRMCRRPAVRDSVQLGAAAGASFLRRAEQSSEELTQGMTSRGFFLDQG